MTDAAETTLWRTIAIGMGGVILTLLGCIYNMDGNRATKQDLVPIADSARGTEAKVDTLSQQFNYLEGQLRAKKVIER